MKGDLNGLLALPPDIPTAPEWVYGRTDEWRDWAAGRTAAKVDRPDDIPASPRGVYADEWTSWG